MFFFLPRLERIVDDVSCGLKNVEDVQINFGIRDNSCYLKFCFPPGCDETNGNVSARVFGLIHDLEKRVPSSNLSVRYGNCVPFIDDLAMKNSQFPI